MDYEDEIILEQYFPYRNMSIDERNLCINLLLHTKDIDDSEVVLKNNSNNYFDLLFLNTNKDNDGAVRFEGATCSDDENRMICGFIVRSGNKYYVRTDVYRCNDVVLDDEKEYSVSDEFVFKNGKVLRRSRYSEGDRFYESEIRLLTDLELDEYLETKARKFRK